MSHLLHQNMKIMKRITNLVETFLFTRRLNLVLVKACIFFIAFGLTSQLKAQYVSGDTSVCPGATVAYTFANGPWTVSILGGGSFNPVPVMPTNSFTISWGLVPGTFQIRLTDGITTIFQQVFVEGDIAMACDDLVNVSLDGNCRAVITPGVILEGEQYPADAFQVTVYNTNNVPMAGNVVTYANLGQVLKVHIRHICSGISCWGRIFIEDKYIPLLECNPSPYLVGCDDDYSPDSIGFPLPPSADVTAHATKSQCYIVEDFDLCCDVELCYYDVYIKNGCNARYYAQVERNWTAVDCKGNKTTCKDSIYIIQATIGLINWPLNYDGFQLPALQCDSIEPAIGPYPAGWNALDNGNPSPYDELRSNGSVKWKGTGYPTNVHCDHIAVTYRDIRIPVCGNSFKLLRTWRVFDWCTGQLEERVQFIKVTDHKAPIVSCSQNYIKFPMDYYSCTGTATIPPPDLIIDCNTTTFTVEYKLAGPDGMPEAGNYRTDNISYRNGNAIITGLPKDTTWVQYVVTDACGNSTKCRVEVLIEDNLQPVAICDEHTVVSLNEQGIASIFATSLDNGSIDNCELDSMAVRRMQDWCGVPGNTDFGSKVTFCCADLAQNPHMVVFRVWDASGNYNDCMVSVTVQEKIPPAISCPPNITVNCGTDLSNLNILGRATANNTCANANVTYVDDTLNFKCGVGTIRRIWKATSLGGLSSTCPQSITVRDNDPLTFNKINWPDDITVNGCKASDAHPDFAGKPIFPVRPCGNAIAGYTDERFYNIGGFCLKIIRHWRVIAWCLYDVNNPNSPGVFNREQIIYVRNTMAPTISSATCAARDTCANDFSCNANLNLVGSATDDCTDDNKLIWSYRVDLNSSGTFGSSQTGNNASGTYPVGVHRIEWTAADSCGNAGKCIQIIRINDCKAPTPFCKPGLITVVMPNNGRIEVSARYFDDKSEDNCTAKKDLKFSFSSSISDSVRTYTCADIDNGIADTIDVTIYITDLWNNQTFCKTKLILQDNGNACPNRFTNGGLISGLVSTSNQAVLQNAHLDLLKDGLTVGSINSEKSGNYMFLDLPEGENYTVRPRKDDDINNGISTADIVLIQKHILGIQKFTSAYQYIAADVNNSQNVTAADISEIRKLILGITDKFKEGVPSWNFLTHETVFDQIDNPWLNAPWKTHYDFSNLIGENKEANFMAIKSGDVNLSAKTTEFSNGIEQRSSEEFYLELDADVNLEPGVRKIPVYGSWNGVLSGFQFSAMYPVDKMEFIGVQTANLDLQDNHVAISKAIPGVLNFSWNSAQGVSNQEGVLFYLNFKIHAKLKVSEGITLRNDLLSPEAYTNELELMSINLRERNTKKAIATTQLHQNEPNPFSDLTVISFTVPELQNVSFSFYTLGGSLIKKIEIVAQKGRNQIQISKQDLLGPGMYYYHMETGHFSGVKKLILNN
ncbi:MAG: T9SS type A sorting domain-containing protein [Saprospiraceae bacterium]|nr:T9SS type A sorting domain-containing protein [Saprospiraceae bacterium]